jgi:hypothetical protein
LNLHRLFGLFLLFSFSLSDLWFFLLLLRSLLSLLFSLWFFWLALYSWLLLGSRLRVVLLQLAVRLWELMWESKFYISVLVNLVDPSLVQVDDEDNIISEDAESLEPWHGDEEREQIINDSVEELVDHVSPRHVLH